MTLDDIATRLNASKKLLNPAFKNEYGITITQFIRQVKIDAAKELLIASDLTLLDISNLLSFSTTTYFVKTFKEITGLTPKYFRQHFFDQHLHL
ncbi:helix-turn-helix transcriptional regulator [Leuconostoc gasicomitatum]|nr:helix-turn-helix transcriptional regulator [Leuconostoc gasicomitatum]